MPGGPSFSTAMQRLGVGCELPRVLSDLGTDPEPLFAEIGIALTAVTPDLRVPFPDLLHLLHRAAETSGCEHVGLLCGLNFALRHHGLIGELMQSAPTVRHAMQDFVRWQPGYSSGAIVYLHRSGPEYALGYGTIAAGTPGAEILYDAIVAVGVRLLRLLTDGRAAPIEAHLSRRPPTDVNYARLLRLPVRFEQHRTCILLDDRAMQTPLPGADAAKHNALLQAIRTHPLFAVSSVSDRVRHEIRRALLDGPPRMSAIADALGFEVRTLRRRLRDEGTSFSLLSDDVRLSVARELLDLTDLSITDIAAATGSASASVFSETFRRWTGTKATDLRTETRLERYA